MLLHFLPLLLFTAGSFAKLGRRSAATRTCSTNAECLKRGLPILKPRSRLRRQNNVCPSPVIRNDLPPCDGTFTYGGVIQACVIPETGTYTISAAGGAGGNNPGNGLFGGYGVLAVGQGFSLLQGTQIQIAVAGVGGAPGGNWATGGGGGSFVYIQACSAAVPLILAAGGGGGGAGGGNAGPGSNGQNAPITQDAFYSGGSAYAVPGAEDPNGGENGGGGQSSNPTLYPGGGGAGYLGNGAAGTEAQGGMSIAGNLVGGAGYAAGAQGGFGGGGGGSFGPFGTGGERGDGGGGGGYSGGGGGLNDNRYGDRGGGGGSSYVAQSYNGQSVSVAYSQYTTSSNGNGYITFTQTA